MLVQAMPYPAAGGGYGSHTYWRVIMLNNHGDASFTGLNEIEMRATAGGADLTTGGTPTVSNTSGGGSAANVFDNNTTTVWAAAGTTNQWAKYQFATPVTVQEVALTINSGLNSFKRAPKDCEVQYSDDNSTWTTAFSFTWDSPLYGSTRAFPQAPFASGFARAWRVNVTANGGDANFTYIQELEFRATAGGADQTAPVGTTVNGNTSGRAFGETTDPWNAFDNAAGNNGGSPRYHTNGFVFPNPVKVEEITIANLSTLGRSPTAFTIDWLGQDGVTWTTQKSVSATWSSVPQTQTFAAI